MKRKHDYYRHHHRRRRRRRRRRPPPLLAPIQRRHPRRPLQADTQRRNQTSKEKLKLPTIALTSHLKCGGHRIKLIFNYKSNFTISQHTRRQVAEEEQLQEGEDAACDSQQQPGQTRRRRRSKGMRPLMEGRKLLINTLVGLVCLMCLHSSASSASYAVVRRRAIEADNDHHLSDVSRRTSQASASSSSSSASSSSSSLAPPPLITSNEYDEMEEADADGGGPFEPPPPPQSAAPPPPEDASRTANSSNHIQQQQPASDFFYLNSLFSHIDKQWKFAEMILIIVISAILNLVTIIGNIMVLISFKMDRSLQTVSNYFLLSLALADLLIGLISMPLYTLYLLLNYWPLGPLMCDIWLAIDYLNSNAAVLNMLIISFDRYFSVTRPLTYRAKRTTKHACLMISCAWILSLTIWTPAIFTYPYFKGRTVQGTDKCEIEFVKANTYLTFVTAILAFYIPVAIMIYLYWRIWLETKKRYRDLTTLFLVSGVGAAAHTRPHHRNNQTSAGTGAGATTTGLSTSTCSQQQQLASANNRRTGSTRSAQHPATRLAASNASKQKQASSGGQSTDEKQQSSAMVLVVAAAAAQEPSVKSSDTAQFGMQAKLDEGQLSSMAKADSDRHQSGARGPTNMCKCPGCPKSSQRQPRPATKCSKCPPAESSLANCKLCNEQQIVSNRSDAKSTIGAASKCKIPATRHGHTHSHGHHHPHSKRSAGGCCASSNQNNNSIRKSSPSCCCCCPSSSCKYQPPRRHSSHRDKNQTTTSQLEEEDAKAGANSTVSCKSKPFWFGSAGSWQQNQNSSTNSLASCAAQSTGRHHKIHPQTLPLKGPNEPTGDDIHLEGDEKLQSTNEGEQKECNEEKASEKGKKQVVDVATSPIDSSCLSLWPLFNNNNQNNNINSSCSSPNNLELEPEDYETRIVSIGHRLKFETNDPKLSKSCCHLRPSTSATATNSSNHHHHHHHHHHLKHHQSRAKVCKLLAPAAGGGHQHHHEQQQTCCCAEAMSVHDAECRLCRPRQRSEQYLLGGHHHNHNHHHHQHSHSHHNHHHSHHNQHHYHHQQQHSRQVHGCKQCHQQQKQQHHQQAQEIPPREAANVHLSRDPQPSSLPILGALQEGHQVSSLPEESIREQSNEGKPQQTSPAKDNDNNSKKNNKKFSQKLTFSDILVDQSTAATSNSNYQRELSSREQKRRELERSNELRMKFGDESDDWPLAEPSRGSAHNDIKFNWFRRLLDPIRETAASIMQPKSILRESRRNRQQQQQQQPDNLSICSSDNNTGQTPPSRRLLNAISGSKSLVSLPIKGMSSKLSGSMPMMAANPGNGGKRRPSSSSSSNKKTSQSRQSSDDSDRSQPRPSPSSNNNGNNNHGKASYSSHHPIQPKSERKAAKTLSTLLLVFIVTWLPYNILVLIKTLSGGEDQVPEKVWNFSYYLCYINSTINPLCYALCNAQFRRTYMRILKCKLSNDQHNSTRRLLVPLQSSTTWNKDLRLNSDATGMMAIAANSTTNNHHHNGAAAAAASGHHRQPSRGSQFQASGSSGHSSSYNGRSAAH